MALEERKGGNIEAEFYNGRKSVRGGGVNETKSLTLRPRGLYELTFPTRDASYIKGQIGDGCDGEKAGDDSKR